MGISTWINAIATLLGVVVGGFIGLKLFKRHKKKESLNILKNIKEKDAKQLINGQFITTSEYVTRNLPKNYDHQSSESPKLLESRESQEKQENLGESCS